MATKKCLYEVLELPRTANFDEIKTAYRRLALRWHPDKNVGNQEAATEVFKTIQHAYTVLSDPNEKAWYDAHRESILRGGDGTNASDDGDDDESFPVNLWPYFSTSVFSGFGDDDKSFYTVYSKVFEEIDEVERNSRNSFAPKFGNSSTVYVQVGEFYDYWSNFVSSLSFAEADIYNYNEAPNRQVRRAMEKENQKLRSVKRKKYQEQVRALVNFVKRRDKRVMQYMTQKQKQEEEKKKEITEKKQLQEEKRRKEREVVKKMREQELEEEEKERNNAKYRGEATSFRLADEHHPELVEVIDNDEDDDNENSNVNQIDSIKALWCPICNKDFKSEGQLENHKNSKAHKKKLSSLGYTDADIFGGNKKESEKPKKGKKQKKTFNENEVKVEEEEEVKVEQQQEEVIEEVIEEVLEEVIEEDETKQNSNNEFSFAFIGPEDIDISAIEKSSNESSQIKKNKEIQSISTIQNDGKKDKKNNKNEKSKKDNNEHNKNTENDKNKESDDDDDEEEDEIELLKNLKISKRNEIISDDEYGIEEDNKKDIIDNKEKLEINSKDTENNDAKNQSKNKKKARRKKKDKKETEIESSACRTCGKAFPSRSKLFDHLEESGHSIVKS